MSAHAVNEIAQIIRTVDGSHSLGAGALATAIAAHLPASGVAVVHRDDLETVRGLAAALEPELAAVHIGVSNSHDVARAVLAFLTKEA